MSDSALLQIYHVNQATWMSQILIYGIYLTVFFQSFQIIRKGQVGQTQLLRAFLYFMLLALFLISSLDLATSIGCSFRMFAPTSLDAPVEGTLFTTPAFAYMPACTSTVDWSWGGIIQNTLLVPAILLSDIFLAFRCYIIWKQHYAIIILLVLLIFADTSIGVLYFLDSMEDLLPFNKINPALLNLLNKTFNSSFLSFITITLVLNALCTSLISFKIWETHRRVYRNVNKSDHLNRVLITILESGAIYTVWMCILVATYIYAKQTLFEDETYVFFRNNIIQIIALVFSIIISRITRSNSTKDSRGDIANITLSGFHARTGDDLGATLPSHASRNAELGLNRNQELISSDEIELGLASIDSTHNSPPNALS